VSLELCDTGEKVASFTVIKRKKSDGTFRYMTRIRVKEQGSVVYNESCTFSKKVSATEWGKRKVLEIEQGGYGNEASQISIRELIYKYINDPHVELGRTKRNVLDLLMSCNIAMEDATNLKLHHIVDHCKIRNESGAGPAVPSQISHLLGKTTKRYSTYAAKA
jgi:hypothetical protein